VLGRRKKQKKNRYAYTYSSDYASPLGANRQKGKMDYTLLIIVMALVLYGVLLVFSASIAEGLAKGNAYYYLIRHVIGTLIGVALMLFFCVYPYRAIAPFAPIVLLGSFILMLAMEFVPGVGTEAGGATRWIYLFGGFTLQPSEFAKLALIAYLAFSIERAGDMIHKPLSGILKYILIIGSVCLIVLMQPDLSGAVIIGASAVGVLFLGGANLIPLFLIGGVGVAGVAMAILGTGYRMDRINAWFDPWAYYLDEGYQAVQSLYALAAGGLFGVGLGQSTQKWYYIPEAHTDFILAICGEELGFIGILVMVALFVMFIIRGFRIALRADSKAGMLLAAGITLMIGIQAFINMGVVSGLLPNTGVTLPFVSYGNNSTIVTLAAVGMLLNVSRSARQD